MAALELLRCLNAGNIVERASWTAIRVSGSSCKVSQEYLDYLLHNDEHVLTVAMALNSIWIIAMSLVTASGSFCPNFPSATRAEPRNLESCQKM